MRASADVRGEGPDLLLLHGIPGAKATWTRVVAELGGAVRTIVPDLLGFGASPPWRGDGHTEEQAAALVALLDEMGVGRVHVAGFDFGGPVAVRLVRNAPARVASLTLAATNLFSDTPVPLPLRIARVPGLGEAAFRLFFGRVGLALMWAVATRDRRAFPYRAFAPALAARSGVRSTRRIFLASLRDLRARYAEIEATLPAIAVPAAVAWGDGDPFFPVAVGRRTADAIPRATFHLFAGCCHFGPGERPAELAAVIAATMARAERPRRE